MRGAAAIAALCLRRWKWVPLGALLLGAFAAFTPFDREGPGTLALAMTSAVRLGVLALLLPVVIAPTVAGPGPDFLFSRPVGWWGVWLGRAAAASLVGLASVAGTALPAWWYHGVRPGALARPLGAFVLALRVADEAMVLAVLGGVATAVYAWYRARQPIASAAIGLALLVGSGALYLVARVMAYGLLRYDSAPLALLFLLLALPVIVFSLVYLAAGRGEPVRAAVFAGIAAAIACVPALVLSTWVLAFAPRHETPRQGHITASPENTTLSGTVVKGRRSNDTSKR